MLAKLVVPATDGSLLLQLGANIERVSEMVCVMRRAAQLDEDQSHHFQQLVTALVRENKVSGNGGEAEYCIF